MLSRMNEPFGALDGVIAPPPSGATLDADGLPVLGVDLADRSMLVVQYALAVITAVCAVLLSRAS